MSWVVLGIVAIVVIALVLRAMSNEDSPRRLRQEASAREQAHRGASRRLNGSASTDRAVESKRAAPARTEKGDVTAKREAQDTPSSPREELTGKPETNGKTASIEAARQTTNARTEPPDTPATVPQQGVIYSVPPEAIPTQEIDETWDDMDVTLVAELPEEIRALQKGYRKVHPKDAIAQKLEDDDNAEIEIVSESFVDTLLVEELLSDDPTGAQALITIEGAARTDRGMRRKQNEDSMLAMHDHFVYVVADGMGGHAAGQLASGIAVETIERAFVAQRFDGEPNTFWPRRGDELARAVEMANLAIFDKSTTDEALNGMGTTVTAARFSPERQRMYVAHVGDSRCYRIRGGRIHQLTNDHTLGAELGATGRMATHLSRSVGIADNVQVELMVYAPQPGDLYLLCSDGLTKMVPEERILDVLSDPGHLEQQAAALIDHANEAGGKDNTTVILLRIDTALGKKDATEAVANGELATNAS